MKKLLLGVFVFALIFSSCNKYADDFQALKDQIAALSTKVDGVAALQTQLTATTAQITALQAAVALLPNATAQTAQFKVVTDALTALDGKITTINTALTNLATTGATAASVAALKTQLDAMVLTAASNQTALTTKLDALQLKLNAAATSADLAAARTDILNLITSSATAADLATTTKIAALKADIQTAIAAGTADVDGKIAALKLVIDASNLDTKTKLDSLILGLSTLSTTVADDYTATQLSITALNLLATSANTSLQILIAQSAMYNGDVYITTDADVDGFMLKLNNMSIINGNVMVNTTMISAAKIANLNVILGKMVAVIGQNEILTGFEVNGWWGPDVITLWSQPGAGHWVSITSASVNDKLAADALVSVRGDYYVGGFDIKDTKIDNVGGNFTYNYPGDYVSNVVTVGMNLILVNQATNGTGNINLPNVNIGTGYWVGDHIPGAFLNNAVTFSSTNTKSINLGLATGGQINNLTAANATDITLGTTAYNAPGLLITAAKAINVYLGAAVSAAGPVTIATGVSATTGTALIVDLSGLKTSGDLTAWVAAACDTKLNVWNSAVNVNIRGDQVLSIPAWLGEAGSTLNAPETKTLTLAMYKWWSISSPATIPTTANLLALENLILGNTMERVDMTAYTKLITADITGVGSTTVWKDLNAGSTGTSVFVGFGVKVPGVKTNLNDYLTTLTLRGVMNTADLNNLKALTSVTTSGIVNSFILNNADAITALTLGHANFEGNVGAGSPGSDLIIQNNLLLASVTTTGLNKLNQLSIHDNAALATLSLASYTLPINTAGFSAIIEVYNNALVGTFTPAVLQFGTTPYREAVINCATLNGLRDYVAILSAVPGATYTNFRVDVDKTTLLVDPLAAVAPVAAQTVGSVNKLSSSMYLNDGVSTIIASLTGTVVPVGRTSTTGIGSKAEMALIKN